MTRHDHIEAVAGAIDDACVKWQKAHKSNNTVLERWHVPGDVLATAAITSLEKLGAYVPEGWELVTKTPAAFLDLLDSYDSGGKAAAPKPAQGKE